MCIRDSVLKDQLQYKSNILYDTAMRYGRDKNLDFVSTACVVLQGTPNIDVLIFKTSSVHSLMPYCVFNILTNVIIYDIN